MSDTFNTTVSNWQGVDDEPTAGSHNLVESGGVNISYKVSAVSDSDFIYDLPIKFKQGQKYSFIVSCDTTDVFRNNTIVLCKTDNTSVADLIVNGGYAIYTHELADDTPLRLYRYRSNIFANAVVEVEIDKNYHAGKEINALSTNLASLNTSVPINTAEIERINDRTGLLLERNSVSANGTVFTNSDVAVGDTVYLTFKLGTSGIGAIGYFDSNDERIEYYGLGTSSASPNAKVSYKTIIPSGFAYAKVIWNAITNVFVEKQLIQEKDLQKQIDNLENIISTDAISTVQGQNLDYVADIIFEQGKTYSIALKSSVDSIINENFLLLCEKTSSPTINVLVYLNGEHVIYTHSLSDRKMHFYRYGTNVLANGTISLEIKKDIFDSEDIDALKIKTKENETNISRINDRTGLLLEKTTASSNSILFTIDNVSIGDIIYLTFKVGASGYGAVGLYNADDERIIYYGKGQSGVQPEGTCLSYAIEIPSGFSYAKILWQNLNYVYIEKQLIQEKSLKGELEDIYDAIPKTATISVTADTTVDYVTDYVFKQNQKYNIRLKSESSDTHINGNFVVLCEKTSNSVISVPIYINGDFVSYTHTLTDGVMHLYRYSSNVLTSGNLYLEVKMDFFDSEDIKEVKNEIKTLKTLSLSTVASTDFYQELPIVFKQGNTYSIRVNSQVNNIFRNNFIEFCDNRSTQTISQSITVNGDALIYTHEATDRVMYLYRYRSNVLETGTIYLDVSQNIVLNEEFDKLKHRTADLEQEVDNAVFKAQSVAVYNCANYDRINSGESIMLFGKERISAKNNININALSGSYSIIKLCIFGDIHVNANEEQKYHWWNTSTGQFDHSGIERAFSYCDGLGCDFLMSMGDNLNDGYGGELQTSELTIWDSIMKKNVQDTLFMTICGNHDTYLRVPRFTGNGIFKVREINFICFFATYVGVSPQQSGAIVSEETLTWLDNILTEHDGEVNIVICHYPLADGSTNGAILDEYTYGEVSGDGHRDDVIQILEEHDVHLYISGHKHAHTFPTYQLGTNLLEINCGSLTSNKNTVLQGGSFIVAEINADTRKFNGVVYGVDTLEPRTHEVITGNNEPISDLTNIDV